MADKRVLTIKGVSYTYTVYVERRSSARASITQRGIHIRLPKHLSSWQREEELNNLLSWVKQKLLTSPPMIHTDKVYTDGDYINTHSKVYQLSIMYRESEKNFAKIKGNVIHFKIARKHSPLAQQAYIVKQLRKLLAKAHTEELQKHVERLNLQHFQQPVHDISYKYTKSRWGACHTSSRSINLSTRLLLAPLPILEYVIIHELAHLIEANHSPRFWNIVKSVDPSYKQKKRWLKMHGHTLVI